MFRLLKANGRFYFQMEWQKWLGVCLAYVGIYQSARTIFDRQNVNRWVIMMTLSCATFVAVAHTLRSPAVIQQARHQLHLPESRASFHFSFYVSTILYCLVKRLGYILITYLAIDQQWINHFGLASLSLLFSGLLAYILFFTRERGLERTRIYLGKKANFMNYIGQYMTLHKNFILNSLSLWGLAGGILYVCWQYQQRIYLPFGLIIICLNTPLGTILSISPMLQRKLKHLPNERREVVKAYFLIVWLWNQVGTMVYWMVAKTCFQQSSLAFNLLTVSLPLLASGLTVWLEVQHPIKNWQVEQDIMHHPRKYLVSLLLLIVSILVKIVFE